MGTADREPALSSELCRAGCESPIPSPMRVWASDGSCGGGSDPERLFQGSEGWLTGGPFSSFGMSYTKLWRVYSEGVCCVVSIRIASLGQASTQNPQTMQRSSSITNWVGNFSMTRDWG